MRDSTPRSLTPEWLPGLLPAPSGRVLSELFPAEGLGGDFSWRSVEGDIIVAESVPPLEF